MTDETDFSKYPASLAEVKAIKSSDPSEWTPVDALIHVLREIQTGQLDCNCLIIFASHEKDNMIKAFCSGEDIRTILGTVEQGRSLLGN